MEDSPLLGIKYSSRGFSRGRRISPSVKSLSECGLSLVELAPMSAYLRPLTREENAIAPTDEVTPDTVGRGILFDYLTGVVCCPKLLSESCYQERKP